MDYGARFTKWGLGLFLFGVFLTFGIIAHYCVGARWPTGDLFMKNITLWWACPWTLSVAAVQAGSLGMVALGLARLLAARLSQDDSTGVAEPTALRLCIAGLLGVFAVGYPGYFFYDAIWPSFFYSPVPTGKNVWLLSQGLFIAVYLTGAVLMFNAVRHALNTVRAGDNRQTGRAPVLAKHGAIAGATVLTLFATLPITWAQAPIMRSPSAEPMPAGPIEGTKLTEEYARLVARDAYFWAWPLVNIYNRRLAYENVPETILSGPVPAAPLNHLGMLTDYIVPEERIVACPNQDVVYGVGSLALDVSAVVIQVPDFGDRFWVYQVVDTRSDSFADLGKMYGTTPGFYLLAGPNWTGNVPKGITKVFRATTNTGYVIPRVFQDDSPEDNKAVRTVTQQVMMYPLAEFDGKLKSFDWSTLPKRQVASGGDEEVKWVVPEKFFDVLPLVLADAPPLPGEETRYAQVVSLLAAAKSDPQIKAVMTKAAIDADNDLVKPLFEFRNWGLQLPHRWSTQINGASFGTDYFTRTAVGKSNIFVNKPGETKYFYQDLDATGKRLNGGNRYTVTFAKDQTPPVRGFWSLTLYNQHHFFAPNEIKRYSTGTKNKALTYNPDGSLTIYVQAEPPADALRGNWLPAPKSADFSLYLRSYWPRVEVTDGTWTPPAVELQGGAGSRALQ